MFSGPITFSGAATFAESLTRTAQEALCRQKVVAGYVADLLQDLGVFQRGQERRRREPDPGEIQETSIILVSIHFGRVFRRERVKAIDNNDASNFLVQNLRLAMKIR
jgi:hypothetical protein